MPTPEAKPALSWSVTARDGCSTAREATELLTNALTGAVMEKPHRYVEVASGLNYRNEAGQWSESQDLVELATDGGAAAVRGPTKVHFQPNLNTEGAITLITRSNRVFRTHPLALAYYDASSGKSVVISRLKDCTGELLPPNQIVYRSVFAELEGDVRFTYTKAAFECDVILRSQPPPPEQYGLNPKTTRLEVWHEWLGVAAPRVTSRLLAREPDAGVRSRMAEPDLTDQILDFGDAWFPTGAAFTCNDSTARSPSVSAQVRVPNLAREPEKLAVAKTWLTTPRRAFLSEAVRWPEVQAKLRRLPLAPRSAFAVAAQERVVCLSQLPAPTSAKTSAAIEVARSEYRPVGLLLDYITVDGYEDYTFAANTTYLVGATYFQGTVTIEPNAILKYHDWGRLLCYGSFNIQGNGTPAILTSKDEDYIAGWPVGDRIDGQYASTGCPSYSAEAAIWSYFQSGPVNINGVRIRWARTAVLLDANPDPNDPYGCSGLTHTIWDSGIELSETGIYLNNGTCDIGGSYYTWQCAVQTPTAVSSWPEGCSQFTGGFLNSSCPSDACNCPSLLSQGFKINLETTGEGLRVKSTAQTTPLPFVNLASSGRGTVARIEVPNPWNPSLTASRVAGEYYTTPNGGLDDGPNGPGNPSRTTVDRYGNVWVGNRDVDADGFGSVTKIGVVIGGIRCNQNGTANVDGDYLKPNPALPGGFIYNTCIDRNGDGLIRTSPGRKSNGSLRRLGWANESVPSGDEAVIYYVRTTPTKVRSLAVDRDNNLWVGSRENGWQELIDNATGAPVTGQKFLYGKGGYGAVFDPYGALWSSGYGEGEGLLWRPPGPVANALTGTAGGILPGTLYAYGIGIDPTTADVWLGDFYYGGLWQFKQGGCMNKFRFTAPDNSSGNEIKGIVVDGSGDVWVAHAKFAADPPGEAIYRFRNTGEYRGRVVLNYPALGVTGKSPHGVCVDSQQRIWAICFRPAEDGKYYAMRIDPTQGVDPNTGNVVGRVVEAVDLGAFPAFDGDYHGPYNYSDMSGFVTLAATQPAGFWNYVEDSGTDNMRWLRLTLNTLLNSGDVFAEVRAANRVTDLPAWPFRRLNGASGSLPLDALGIKGRYLEARVTLLRNFGATVTQGPVLKSVCITRGTPGTALQITQHPKSAILDRGASASPVFTVAASGTGLHYQWTRDGASVGTDASILAVNNAQYSNAGKYKVRVTDSFGAFLDSAEARLHVVSTPAPFPRPEVQLVGDNPFPVLNDPVTFTASMDISPSVGPVRYQWRKNGAPIPGANGLCDGSQSPTYAATHIIAHVVYTNTGEYSVVFTNEFWKSASAGVAVTVDDPNHNPVPMVSTISITHANGTPYPMPITVRTDPPKLTATTWVTPACVQWYRTDSGGGSYGFKQPIGAGTVTGSSPPYTLTYTFPNPVPCEMVNPPPPPPQSGNYYMVEVFDAGRVSRASDWPRVWATPEACP